MIYKLLNYVGKKEKGQEGSPFGANLYYYPFKLDFWESFFVGSPERKLYLVMVPWPFYAITL